MYVEISAPSKRFTTHVTLVQFITSSVNALVFLKCPAVPKCFAAYVTDARFITGVNAFVYDEVALLCKGFITRYICTVYEHHGYVCVPEVCWNHGKLCRIRHRYKVYHPHEYVHVLRDILPE